jgi:UbiD family decarboxylase
MKPSFRDVLQQLEDASELRRIKKPVDPRHLSALAAQAREATFFESITGYPDWRVAGALVSTRKRLALAMGCSE